MCLTFLPLGDICPISVMHFGEGGEEGYGGEKEESFDIFSRNP